MIKQLEDMEDRNDNSGLYETGIDDNGCFDEAQSQAELDEWINTPEAQLSSFTTQQLNHEIYRRLLEPYDQSLKDMRFILDSIIAGQSKPF